MMLISYLNVFWLELIFKKMFSEIYDSSAKYRLNSDLQVEVTDA